MISWGRFHWKTGSWKVCGGMQDSPESKKKKLISSFILALKKTLTSRYLLVTFNTSEMCTWSIISFHSRLDAVRAIQLYLILWDVLLRCFLKLFEWVISSHYSYTHMWLILGQNAQQHLGKLHRFAEMRRLTAKLTGEEREILLTQLKLWA